MSRNQSVRARADNVSAYIVLDKKGTHVATVQFFFGSGGVVQCDVTNHRDASTARCLATAMATGRVTAASLEKMAKQAPEYYGTQESRNNWAARQMFAEQTCKAGGYGYDKATAALSGMIIDGHTIANHCGYVPEDTTKRDRLLKAYMRAMDTGSGNQDQKYWDERARRIGCRFANYATPESAYRDPKPTRTGRYQDLHFISGLERLSVFGYRVIQAI